MVNLGEPITTIETAPDSYIFPGDLYEEMFNDIRHPRPTLIQNAYINWMNEMNYVLRTIRADIYIGMRDDHYKKKTSLIGYVRKTLRKIWN